MKTFTQIATRAKLFADKLNKVGEERRQLIRWYIEKALISHLPVEPQLPNTVSGLHIQVSNFWTNYDRNRHQRLLQVKLGV